MAELPFLTPCLCGHGHEHLGGVDYGPCPDPVCPCRAYRAPVALPYRHEPGRKAEVNRHYDHVDPIRGGGRSQVVARPLTFEHDRDVRREALTMEELRRHERGECRC